MVSTRSTTQMIRRSQKTSLTLMHELPLTVKRIPKKMEKKESHIVYLSESGSIASSEDSVIDSSLDYDSEDPVIDSSLDYDSEDPVIEMSDYEFNCSEIDFDDAHDEWMANKKRGPTGTYVYICGKKMKNDKKCQHATCDKIGIYSGCRRHYMWEEKEHKSPWITQEWSCM
jgi:hypothetical protein